MIDYCRVCNFFGFFEKWPCNFTGGIQKDLVKLMGVLQKRKCIQTSESRCTSFL